MQSIYYKEALKILFNQKHISVKELYNKLDILKIDSETKIKIINALLDNSNIEYDSREIKLKL